MKKHILLFRQIDRDKFEAVRAGKKKIETRAGTEKYRKIVPGDVIVFKCGKEKFEKSVKNIGHAPSADVLFKKYKLKDIMPFVDSVREAERVYHSFPGYKEKIKKFGLLAFELKNL